MRFAFRPIRNKDNLLLQYTEEDIMSALGVPLTNKRFTSPFRADRNPDCYINRSPDNGRIYYYDWAVHDKPLDIFDLVMYLHSCDFNNAIRIIWDIMDGGVHRHIAVEKREIIRYAKAAPSDIRVQSRDWIDDDLKWWASYGISAPTLSKYNVSPVSTVVCDGSARYVYSERVKPAYAYQFEEGIKVYFPHKDKYRFLCNNNNILQGYEQLPSVGEDLVITKSLKDCMLLDQYDIASVAPQAETVMCNDDMLTELRERFSNIVVLMDNDSAGRKALRKWKNLDFTICMIPRVFGVKDLSDFYKRYGPDQTDWLINTAKEYYTV